MSRNTAPLRTDAAGLEGGLKMFFSFPGRLTGDFFVFWGRKWAANGVMHGGGMNVPVWRTVSENIWKKISYMT